MTNAAVELKNQFADGTTRTLTIEPLDVNSDAIINSKTNIKALYADVSEIEEIYLSENGAKFTGVKEATIKKVADAAKENNLAARLVRAAKLPKLHLNFTTNYTNTTDNTPPL